MDHFFLSFFFPSFPLSFFPAIPLSLFHLWAGIQHCFPRAHTLQWCLLGRKRSQLQGSAKTPAGSAPCRLAQKASDCSEHGCLRVQCSMVPASRSPVWFKLIVLVCKILTVWEPASAFRLHHKPVMICKNAALQSEHCPHGWWRSVTQWKSSCVLWPGLCSDQPACLLCLIKSPWVQAVCATFICVISTHRWGAEKFWFYFVGSCKKQNLGDLSDEDRKKLLKKADILLAGLYGNCTKLEGLLGSTC